MNQIDRKLWPFSHRTAVFAVGAVLFVSLIALAILRITLRWPTAQSENGVLLGVAVLSLLPLVLALIDVIVDRGAVIEYAGVKVDFSQTREMGTPGITVPPNIGVRGRAVSDSGTNEIVAALKQAAASDIVIIDLEDGDAWWETRLLVLLAGADRLKKPETVVFVGTDRGRNQVFQGWSSASVLLPLVVRANRQYERSLEATHVAVRQWDLVERAAPAVAGDPVVVANPGLPLGLSSALGVKHQWMVFNPATGQRNEFLAEQLLQNDLGEKIEQAAAGPTRITLVRLEELFRPVLHAEHIDLSWPPEQQLDAFFATDAGFLAITQDGRYSTLVSRITLMNQLLKDVVRPKPRTS
jgi:hypothetical protein